MVTQIMPPNTFEAKKKRGFILPIPATSGANVRIIGTNLDNTIVFFP